MPYIQARVALTLLIMGDVAMSACVVMALFSFGSQLPLSACCNPHEWHALEKSVPIQRFRNVHLHVHIHRCCLASIRVRTTDLTIVSLREPPIPARWRVIWHSADVRSISDVWSWSEIGSVERSWVELGGVGLRRTEQA